MTSIKRHNQKTLKPFPAFDVHVRYLSRISLWLYGCALSIGQIKKISGPGSWPKVCHAKSLSLITVCNPNPNPNPKRSASGCSGSPMFMSPMIVLDPYAATRMVSQPMSCSAPFNSRAVIGCCDRARTRSWLCGRKHLLYYYVFSH